MEAPVRICHTSEAAECRPRNSFVSMGGLQCPVGVVERCRLPSHVCRAQFAIISESILFLLNAVLACVNVVGHRLHLQRLFSARLDLELLCEFYVSSLRARASECAGRCGASCSCPHDSPRDSPYERDARTRPASVGRTRKQGEERADNRASILGVRVLQHCSAWATGRGRSQRPEVSYCRCLGRNPLRRRTGFLLSSRLLGGQARH